MTRPDETGQADRVRSGRRIVRVVLLCVVVAAMLLLAVAGLVRG
jgi:hypothetical protein